MENPGDFNVLQYANAVRLRFYRREDDDLIWIRASLKSMDDINGTNTIDIADLSRGQALEDLVECLKSPDTDWMKYDSPGEEEWYVLASLLDK